MKKKLYIFIMMLFACTLLLGALETTPGGPVLQKPMETSDFWVNVNRMNGVFRNNGTWFYDNVLGDWGLEWPQGSGLSPVFAAGQFLGAMVNDTARVAGVQHSATEFQAGQIISGVAGNKLDAAYRWYAIYPGGVGDWTNWPFDQGAPALKAADGSDSLGTDGNKIPRLIGDVTAYCVFNDYADHTEYSTKKLGAEIGMTVWAFNRADAIGDMVFLKWTIVNKSPSDWDDTYFAIWSDPDLGDGWDDFVGCDSTLGLGFCYNAYDNDQNYGVAPPAFGIDFFQGPIIDSPGDTVSLPDGTVMVDKKQLKMTAFVFYNNDDSNQGNPQSGGDVWNYLRGYWRDGNPITYGGTGTDPGGVPTAFMFPSDPETESDLGWLDNNESDRRFFMTTGPFLNPMWVDSDLDGIAEFGEPGVQEIVAGALVGKGSSNLNSVTFLKAIDEIAQLAYDIDFALPAAPKQPVVNVSETDGGVLLTWDDRSEFMDDGITPYNVADIVADGLVGQMMVVDREYKQVTDGTFDFTGYTIYQYSDASGSDPIVYQKLGVTEISDTEPYTGPRMILLTSNKNPNVGNVGNALVNGQEYYFGINANSYCEFAIPQDFPSPSTLVIVTPQLHAGERYSAAYGDTVAVTYSPISASIPAGDGIVVPIVVDPAALTGHDYEVRFKLNDDDEVIWDLFDATLGETVLADQTNQRGDDAYTVVDGLKVIVSGPLPGIKEVVELDPATQEVFDANLWGSLNNYGRSQEWPVFVISENAGTDYTRVDRFGLMTPKDYEIIFTDTDSTLAWDYFTDGVLKDANGIPEFIPATFWRIDADGSRTRITVCILDNEADGTWDRTGGLGIFGTPTFDMFYVYDNAEYVPADVATYISTDDGTTSPGYGPWGAVYPAINRFTISMYFDVDGYAAASDLDADGVFYGPPHAGEIIRVNTYKPNSTNDVFSFTTPDAKTVTKADLKEDLKKINVVPNPYYGYHKNESDIFNRWIQFTYLPADMGVKIRIFDLAGNLIRTLDKPVDATTLLQWDLKNEYELPIASGIYIYHVDVSGVGEKVGKMAIFAPNERLDTY